MGILDVPCALLKPILQVSQCPLSQVSTTWPPGQGKVALLTSLLLLLLEVLLLWLLTGARHRAMNCLGLLRGRLGASSLLAAVARLLGGGRRELLGLRHRPAPLRTP